MSANTPASPSSPRQRQRQQTRQRILDAAVNSFARAGFDASSLAEIAARAGVKKALIQYHFQTKVQLWQAAARDVWTQRNQRMATYIARHSDIDYQTRMRQAFTTMVEFTQEHPQWLWFMFHEAAAGGTRMAWLIDNLLGDDYVRGETFIRQYQARGLIRQGPPLHLLHLITGALTYNLLVAPQTLRATHTDLTSATSITLRVELLLAMLAPAAADPESA